MPWMLCSELRTVIVPGVGYEYCYLSNARRGLSTVKHMIVLSATRQEKMLLVKLTLHPL